jgi:hypothetical protein
MFSRLVSCSSMSFEGRGSASETLISVEIRFDIPESWLDLGAVTSEVVPSSAFDDGWLESTSMLRRMSVLGLGLAAGEERFGDCDIELPVLDFTMARARRSWSRSFLRAFEALREIAKKSG